jgi:hypothetical protein
MYANQSQILAVFEFSKMSGHILLAVGLDGTTKFLF